MNYVTPMIIAVKKAGALALAHFRSKMAVYTKNDGSIVTQADLASEALLKQELAMIIPGSGFLAEESGIIQGNEYVWVIDPIDGTKNFERGLPYFCISVALMYQEEIIAAVTYAPAFNDLFYAQKGCGAWLNDKQLSLPQKDWSAVGVLAVVSDSCIRRENRLDLVRVACRPASSFVRFRVHGAAALDIAYAAAGMVDLVLFENLKWWDVAAGILLVQEAGGLAVDSQGAFVKQSSSSLIAGNVTICNLFLSNYVL